MSGILIVLYLILEYFRPHQMYSVLDSIHITAIVIFMLVINSFINGDYKNIFSKLNYLVLTLLLWILISTINAVNVDIALISLGDFLKIVIIYIALVISIKNKKLLYIYITTILIIYLKYFEFVFRKIIMGNDYTVYIGNSILQNPGDFGTSIMSFFGLIYYSALKDDTMFCNIIKMKWVYSLMLILTPLVLLYTNSRAPVLALLIIMLMLLYKSKKKLIGLLVIIGTILILIYFNPNLDRFMKTGTSEDRTGNDRIETWKSAYDMLLQHPITGVGPNNYVYVNKNIYFNKLTHVQHNTFLEVSSELGIIGLIIYCWIITIYFKNIINNRIALKSSIDCNYLYLVNEGIMLCMVGYVISSAFINVFYYPFMWSLILINVSLTNIIKNTNVLPALN